MKKFNFYFKKGFVLAKMALKGKSLFTKLLLGLYLILSFFGKFFLFTRPVFLIADNNLAMMIVEGHDFKIEKIFEGINRKKRYSSVLLSCLFVEGIALAATLLLVVPFVVLCFTYPPLYNPNLSPIIFVVIFGIAALVLAIALQIIYLPMGFVSCKGKDLSSGDVLLLSAMGSENNRGKIVGIALIDYLIIAVVIGLLIFIPIFLGNNFFDEDNYVAIWVNFVTLIDLIVLMILDIFVLSSVKLSMRISLYSLFFDATETKHIVIAKKGSAKDVFTPLFTDDKEVKENE